MAVFTIFGTPSSDWEKNKSISEVMSRIEMIDMSRFEKKEGANQSSLPIRPSVTARACARAAPAVLLAGL
jgi:hypothetical protein